MGGSAPGALWDNSLNATYIVHIFRRILCLDYVAVKSEWRG
jgi:hypothetical protein